MELEKVHDKIRWDFMRDSLICTKFPSNLVCVIMHCISSSSLQLLWNEALTEKVIPSRGIRQGDVLSPYLLVLGMERFGQSIYESIDNEI